MPVEYRIIAARRDFSKTDRPGPAHCIGSEPVRCEGDI